MGVPAARAAATATSWASIGIAATCSQSANRTPTSRMEGDVSVWVGTPEQIAETLLSYREVGFHTFVAELPAPYDEETMESLVREVKPMVA